MEESIDTPQLDTYPPPPAPDDDGDDDGDAKDELDEEQRRQQRSAPSTTVYDYEADSAHDDEHDSFLSRRLSSNAPRLASSSESLASQRFRTFLYVGATFSILLAAFLFSLSYRLYPQTFVPPTIQCSIDAASSYAAASNSSDRLARLRGEYELPDGVGNNLHLSHDECEAAFPKLWPRLVKVKERQRENGGVRKVDVERATSDEGTWVAVIDGNLYIKNYHKEWMSRVSAILGSLYQAVLTSPEPIPDVEFYFRAKDSGYPGPHFELDNHVDQLEESWLIPDFGFYSWPEPILTSYKGVRQQIAAIESTLTFTAKPTKLVSPAPHTEGQGAYSGRLKYLLNCRSVVIAPRLNYYQHFHDALDSDPESPNQNIVMLSESPPSWDSLPATMDNLLANMTRAELIADNAWRTMGGRNAGLAAA
ncbi:hypothetical protein MNV49_005980 [Pseudohyphozyma bogoriensis]|nr:hypothetical protein MNV49_005980 [Pseudohyphozyma bogoriensis]